MEMVRQMSKEMRKLLAETGACYPAVAWVGGKSFRTAWETCTEPSWMLWLVGELRPAHATTALDKLAVKFGYTGPPMFPATVWIHAMRVSEIANRRVHDHGGDYGEERTYQCALIRAAFDLRELAERGSKIING